MQSDRLALELAQQPALCQQRPDNYGEQYRGGCQIGLDVFQTQPAGFERSDPFLIDFFPLAVRADVDETVVQLGEQRGRLVMHTQPEAVVHFREVEVGLDDVAVLLLGREISAEEAHGEHRIALAPVQTGQNVDEPRIKFRFLETPALKEKVPGALLGGAKCQVLQVG